MGGPETGRPFSLGRKLSGRSLPDDDKKYQCYVVVGMRSRTLQIASTGSEIVPSIFRRLFNNQHAATLIEYSLIAALIATATVSGMGAVGTGLRTVMASAANAMN